MSIPWHDILFKGYGLNKIIHLESLNATGYKWVQQHMCSHAFDAWRAGWDGKGQLWKGVRVWTQTGRVEDCKGRGQDLWEDGKQWGKKFSRGTGGA